MLVWEVLKIQVSSTLRAEQGSLRATKIRGAPRTSGGRPRNSGTRASDPELLHPAAQGVGMHLEDLRRSPGSFDDPVGPLQRGDDVSPLGLLQGGGEPRSGRLVEAPAGLRVALDARPGPEAGRGGEENPGPLQRPLGEHDRPPDEVFQLPDVPRPRGVYGTIPSLRGNPGRLPAEPLCE